MTSNNDNQTKRAEIEAMTPEQFLELYGVPKSDLEHMTPNQRAMLVLGFTPAAEDPK